MPSINDHIKVYIWDMSCGSAKRTGRLFPGVEVTVGHAALEVTQGGKVVSYFSLWPEIEPAMSATQVLTWRLWKRQPEKCYNCFLPPDYNADKIREGGCDAAHKMVFYDVNFVSLLGRIAALQKLATPQKPGTTDTVLRWTANGGIKPDHHNCATSVYSLIDGCLNQTPTLPGSGSTAFNTWAWVDYYKPGGLLNILKKAKRDELTAHPQARDFDITLRAYVMPATSASQCRLL